MRKSSTGHAVLPSGSVGIAMLMIFYFLFFCSSHRASFNSTDIATSLPCKLAHMNIRNQYLQIAFRRDRLKQRHMNIRNPYLPMEFRRKLHKQRQVNRRVHIKSIEASTNTVVEALTWCCSECKEHKATAAFVDGFPGNCMSSEEWFKEVFEQVVLPGNLRCCKECATAALQAQDTTKRPPVIPDSRFDPDLKNKWFICDNKECGTKVEWGGQNIPFLGNFAYDKCPPLKYADKPRKAWSILAKQESWEAGMWDATWYCVKCLTAHHGCSKTEIFEKHIGNFTEQRAKANARRLKRAL